MIPGSANPLLLKSAAAAGGLQIERSLRFNSADSAYLNRTYGSPTTQNTFTWAGWVKLGALSTTRHLFGVSTNHSLGFTTGDALNLTFGGTSALTTATVFRDPSAWYHIVWTQSGTSHTLYVNNVSVGTATATSSVFNTAVAHQIGAANTANYFNGYLTNIHFIDGQALTPSSFTETDATTGQLIPKTYTGTYGLISVAAATGALPVFNTTDTYGAVKGTGTRTDTNSASIVLALPMDGTNGGTSFGDQSAVIKGSGSAKTLTVNGNTNTSTAQSKFYGSSGFFDGTGDYLSGTNADFAFGTGDFTVECWARLSSVTTEQNFVSTRTAAGSSTAWSLSMSSSSKVYVYTSGFVATGSTSLTANAWNHIAITRSGSTFRIFVNGVQDASATNSQDFSTQTLGIGLSSDGAQYPLTGYLQDVRLYKGVAKYTSNFSPVVSLNNSFNLLFADNSSTTASTLGKDTSGLSNNWTPNNFSISDAVTSVAAATGALPILNTTGTYGTVLDSGTRADSFASSLQFCIPGGTSAGLNLTDQNPTGRVSALRNLSGASLVNSTAVSKFYGGSLRVPLNVAGSFSLDVWTSILSGPFTIEAWVYLVSTTMNNGYGWAILDGRTSLNGQVQLGMLWVGLGGNKAGLAMSCQPTTGPTATHYITDNGASGQFPVGQWVHCAQSKDSSGTVRTFKNGIKVAETAGVTGTLAINYAEFSGWLTSFGYSQEFHVSDVRVYSAAKYTSNFNPPSSTANPAAAVGIDSLADSPTNYGTDTGVGAEVRGNYCTWSPLDLASTTLANGNLQASGATDLAGVTGTIGVSSGKWYWEIFVGSVQDVVGIWPISSKINSYPGSSSTSYGYYGSSGNKYNNTTPVAYGAAFTSGDIIGVALDLDVGTLTFYKNGASQGTAFSSLTGGFRPAVRAGNPSTPSTGTHLNAGQRAFAYTAPAGFKALCTQNLPEGTITTSGSFTGNASVDGPVVYLNGVPTAMTINSNAVTFATHADKLSNGFKLRTSSTSYNTAGSNTYLITTTGSKFKFARAQTNP